MRAARRFRRAVFNCRRGLCNFGGRRDSGPKSLPLFIKGRWRGGAAPEGIKHPNYSSAIRREQSLSLPFGQPAPFAQGSLGERGSLPLFIKGRWAAARLLGGDKKRAKPAIPNRGPTKWARFGEDEQRRERAFVTLHGSKRMKLARTKRSPSVKAAFTRLSLGKRDLLRERKKEGA